MDSLETIGQLFVGIVLILCVFAVLKVIWSWCVAESEERGVSPFLIAFIAVLSFPIGWILWMVFRPPVRVMQRVRVGRRLK